MGWFWDPKPADPYEKLDPTLREYLDKESPVKYEDTKSKAIPSPPSQPKTASSNDTAPNSYRTQLGLDAPGLDIEHQNSTPNADKPAVPRESLFQDGRYAHLWKNYRPQEELEQAGKSDQDRLTDVVEAYNSRKAAIGRAAVENCVEYQIAERDCFSNGGWAQTMSMCRTEVRAFNRCYEMQARFLKALGYLAQPRSDLEEERIQMHADKLYHEMLERERVTKEAKEQGLEVPQLPPLIQAENTTKVLGEDSAWARARRKARDSGLTDVLNTFTPEKQEEIKKRLVSLPKEERELEMQLIAAESRASLEYAEQIAASLEEEKQLRAQRRERGKETVGDTIKRLWGWDR